MKMKIEIDLDDVNYRIECHPEDEMIKGNAIDSGDKDEEAKQEKWIQDELDSGNQWAWCSVRVVAEIEMPGSCFEGDDYLGCCSYKNQTDFEKDGYFKDMKSEALKELIRTLKDVGAEVTK